MLVCDFFHGEIKRGKVKFQSIEFSVTKLSTICIAQKAFIEAKLVWFSDQFVRARVE